MTDKRRGIQSVEIGFRILGRLEKAKHTLSLKDLALATGMSPSRVQFYLVSFLRVGMVNQEGPGGRYRLGPTAIRLGVSALSQVDVLETARSKMEEVRDKTSDTIFLSVWGSQGPTVVNRLDGDKIAPLEVRVGAIMPLLGSATGKTFLAYLPRAVTSDLLRREVAAVRRNGGKEISVTKIQKAIADIRSHGLATTRGGVLTGIVALAVPVVDHAGSLRCSFTLMGYDRMLNIDYRGQAASILSNAAKSVSQACGFVGNIWPAALS